MGSRRVLGNDPFQRGAAPRTPAATPETPVPAPAEARGEPGKRAPPRSTAPKAAATPRPKAPRPGRSAGTAPRAPPRTPSAPARERREGTGESPPPAGPAAVARPGVPLPAPAVPAPAPAAPEKPAPPAVPPAKVGHPPAVEPPILTWGSASSPTAEARTPSPGAGPPIEAATTGLVEALRDAPGVLSEAWSALEAALRALRAGLGTSGGEQLDLYGRDARLSEAVAPLVDFLYSRWFRVEVEGAAHVPAGGALLVANHAGALPLDGPMLHEALRRERPELPEARWLAEDQVFYAPLLGTLFNRLGAVRASPDSATRLLAEGRPVLIFPEGIQGIGKPFRERYRLQRFGRGGFVKLALRTGKPILPVAIMGAEETLPLLGKLPGGPLGVPYLPVTPPPLPAKWRIRIGEPLAVPPGAKDTDLSLVESLVEATRSTIEHMLRELLGARSGVFLG